MPNSEPQPDFKHKAKHTYTAGMHGMSTEYGAVDSKSVYMLKTL